MNGKIIPFFVAAAFSVRIYLILGSSAAIDIHNLALTLYLYSARAVDATCLNVECNFYAIHDMTSWDRNIT